MSNIPCCNVGGKEKKYSYETKIGHEPQILISASLMTHCYKGEMVCFCKWSKTKMPAFLLIAMLCSLSKKKKVLGREL